MDKSLQSIIDKMILERVRSLKNFKGSSTEKRRKWAMYIFFDPEQGIFIYEDHCLDYQMVLNAIQSKKIVFDGIRKHQGLRMISYSPNISKEELDIAKHRKKLTVIDREIKKLNSSMANEFIGEELDIVEGVLISLGYSQLSLFDTPFFSDTEPYTNSLFEDQHSFALITFSTKHSEKVANLKVVDDVEFFEKIGS